MGRQDFYTPLTDFIATQIEVFQGRIQDLSEGDARFISEQKNPDLGTKKQAEGEFFFEFHVLH